MSSRREEERNEKIIRGLMKLPPNRRCINCNSLGPQYVCTSFWTFICITCSGIHREFTHRVKSVSMSKFTSQEVDALQKGGNQRARELFLKAWDPSNRLPDNSNVDKVREFIKNVYVNKMYSNEASSNKPPRDPQSLRNQEDETRRASSYHSYSQSPPYDFQYEERRYGKQAAVLTRKPGSDRGPYEGKLASFLSPTHLSDDGFANEGSNPRVSDYSVSGGGDPFRSEALSPVSQRKIGSPSSETSAGDISGQVPQSSENIRRNEGKTSHPQRTKSTGSFGSIDSNLASFQSINFLPEAGAGSEHSAEVSLEKSSSLPLQPPSSAQTFNDLDLFSAPFAPSAINSNPQSTQQSSQSPPQNQPLDLFATLCQQHPLASFNEKASSTETQNTGGWATFDVPQNPVHTMPSSDGNVFGSFNPFSINQSSHQNPASHDPFVPTNAFAHGKLQSVPAAVNHNDLWNAFGDSTGQQLNARFVQSTEKNVEHSTVDAGKVFDFGTDKVDTSTTNQVMTNDSSHRTANEAQPPPSTLSSHFSTMPTYSFDADIKSTNPFDMPFDSNMESGNMVWDVSSLEGALPIDTQMPPASSVEVNESWFTENSMPSFAPVPSGVPFDSTTASLGFMAGQAPYAQMPNIHGQGPVASVGGNPFA